MATKKKQLEEQEAAPENTTAAPLEEASVTTHTEVEEKPAEAPKSKMPIFKSKFVPEGFLHLNAGEIKGLNSENPDWVVEILIAGERCYLVSKEAYDKHM